MSNTAFRILLLADTHLGFDFPLNPRVHRRRRGPDFFANTRQALQTARQGLVDLVVHGGDLLYRSKVPPRLVEMALEPLLEVADTGTPVVLVPGNHERSALPYPLLAAHEHLHIIDRPRTVQLEIDGLRIAVAGFPCERKRICSRFPDLIKATGAQQIEADIRLLCLHQSVEGAKVGPADFTFTSGADIIPGRDIPAGFAAVLAGHIHRAQVLTTDLQRRPLAAPVLYPGAIERTSFAERLERKFFMTLEVAPNPSNGGKLTRWHFHELPTRELIDLKMNATDLDAVSIELRLREELAKLDADAVVRITITGELSTGAGEALRATNLRALAPPTMDVSTRWQRRNSLEG